MWNISPNDVLDQDFYVYCTELDLLNYLTVKNSLMIKGYPFNKSKVFTTTNIHLIKNLVKDLTHYKVIVVTESFLKDNMLFHPTVLKNKLNINITNLIKSIVIQDYLNKFPKTEHVLSQLKEQLTEVGFIDFIPENFPNENYLSLKSEYFEYVDEYQKRISDFYTILRMMLTSLQYVKTGVEWISMYPTFTEDNLVL